MFNFENLLFEVQTSNHALSSTPFMHGEFCTFTLSLQLHYIFHYSSPPSPPAAASNAVFSSSLSYVVFPSSST